MGAARGVLGAQPRRYRSRAGGGEWPRHRDSYAICEYLDEAYPDISLFGRTLAERAEVRRLVAWFDMKFGEEVTRNLIWERHLKRNLGLGNPDGAAIRAGYANLKPHLDVIGWLADAQGIQFAFQLSALLPAIGLLVVFLPDLDRQRA